MIYEFTWLRSQNRKVRVATSNCVVVQADEPLKWAVGKTYEQLSIWCEGKSIRIKCVSALCSFSGDRK